MLFTVGEINEVYKLITEGRLILLCSTQMQIDSELQDKAKKDLSTPTQCGKAPTAAQGEPTPGTIGAIEQDRPNGVAGLDAGKSSGARQ